MQKVEKKYSNLPLFIKNQEEKSTFDVLERNIWGNSGKERQSRFDRRESLSITHTLRLILS